MFSIHDIQGLKEQTKPSPLANWGLILGCIVVGIISFNVGGNGIHIGISALIAAFIAYLVYKGSCKGYDDYNVEQAKVRASIGYIVNDSLNYFERISRSQIKAQAALDKAEIEFNDGAYAPFWDAIEKAALELGHFSVNLDSLSSSMGSYLQWVPLCHSIPSQFPVPSEALVKLHKLGVENAAAKRMKGLVRNAQRDYHFASIFEQRKTQKVIIAGFENLADILNDIARQIDYHMQSLNNTMVAHNLQMTRLMEDAAKQNKQHHEEFIQADSERADREKRALEMLEDISGRRK